MHLSPPMALIISMVARSISAMQSHRMLPCGVRRSCARWPMPKAGGTSRSRSGWAQARARRSCCAWRSVSSVVQLWPAGVTYCRSSSQIGQAAGGFSRRRVLRSAGVADEGGHGSLVLSRHAAHGLDFHVAVHGQSAGLQPGACRQRFRCREISPVGSIEGVLLALILEPDHHLQQTIHIRACCFHHSFQVVHDDLNLPFEWQIGEWRHWRAVGSRLTQFLAELGVKRRQTCNKYQVAMTYAQIIWRARFKRRGP